MKSNIIIWMAAAALCLAGCAQTPSTNYGELAQMEFDAWASVHRQAGWQQTELGSWITEITDDASRTAVGSADDYPYLRISYTVSSLSGTVTSTTDKATAQKIGTFVKQNYYGPQMLYRGSNGIYAGLEEVVNTMHEGGRARVIIPGWLLTNDRFSTKEKYLANMTESVSALVYDFTVEELISDVDAWELAALKDKLPAGADSLTTGVYYVCEKQSDDSTEFASGDKVYLNYVCRRLMDGYAVDTNIADTAKVYGLYDASKTYSSLLINWADAASGLTMTSSESSMIDGFAAAVFQMHLHEKGHAYMVSSQAYKASGSGNTIPGYCPLIFDLEIVE